MGTAVGLIGKKLGMTHIFDEQGNSVPVTVVQAGPCAVVQVKQSAKEGYEALQLGYGQVAKHRLNKPEQGHFKKHNVEPAKYVKEFRLKQASSLKVGEQLKVDQFQVGDLVQVQGKPIGKGFMGSTKRHHFGRGPMSHGSKSHRLPGSIGAGTTPSRVYKGLKMSGRKPSTVATAKNLTIVKVDSDKNLLLIKGAIPGSTGAIVKILPVAK